MSWTINGKAPDESFVFRSGLRMQITPEGDCREATFMAKGAGLGLRPLDAVQIAYGGTPIFYGEVRVGGNPQDVDGHQFTLRSLALRLREVVIPPGWSAPQQAAHLTVQSLLQAVAPQLGGTVTLGTIQDLGFNTRAVKDAHQQNPYALLEQIVSDGAGLGVKVRFGVNANRQFFCVRAREDVAALTKDMLTGATRFTAPVAEAPCTAVLWFVAKRPDGSWVTHLSEAPEVAVYGQRVKTLSLDPSIEVWPRAGGTYQLYGVDEAGGMVLLDANPPVFASIFDGHLGHDRVSTFQREGELFLRLGFTDSASGIERIVYAGEAHRTDKPGSTEEMQLYTPSPALSAAPEGEPGETITASGWMTGTRYFDTPVYEAYFGNRSADTDAPGTTLRIAEFHPQFLNRALLDRLARFHYNIPATAPADIELREFRPPSACAGYVTLNGWQSPVEAWEYRLSADRGMVVGVLAGQADDPNKLAQAELIKARDGRAVITAVTSQE